MDCDNGQKMWPSMRGDSQKLYLNINKANGKPRDVQGKYLRFTLKLDPKDPVCHTYDLHFMMQIPYDNNAKEGKVIVDVASEHTKVLLPQRVYYYDFELTDDDCDTFTEVMTLGWGTKEIMRDLTTGACSDEPSDFQPC